MKLNNIVLILFLFLVTITVAQNNDKKKIDSIAKSISDKAWSFIEKESDSTLYYVDKGIVFSKENNSKYGEVVNLEVKALYLETVENDYKTSAKTYLEAITLAEKHYEDFLPMLYSGLSNLYNRTTDFERALVYAKKAVKHSKENTRMESGTMLNMAIILTDLEKFDEANKTFKSILKSNKLNPWGLIIAKSGLASNLTDQGKHTEAIALYKETIETDSLKGNKKFRRFYAAIIDISVEIKDKKTVNQYLSIYKKSTETETTLDNKSYYYLTYSSALQLLGDYKNSIIYKDSVIEVNEKLFKKKYDESIVDADTKYQTEKKEEQIKTEKGKRKFWLILSSLSFLTLLIVAFLLIKNNQKRKQLVLSKKSLETALNQRNMLLRETHHRVKNSFQMVSSLLQLQAQGSKAEGAVKALDNAVQRVNSMIILHQQLYAKDDILGIDLKIYINDLTTEIIRSYQTKKININQQVLTTSVNIDTATSIGLLINELATNSIKHAWNDDSVAKIITIQIEESNNTLNFKMFDNGTNKKDTTIKSGYGSELIEILIDRLEATKLQTEQQGFALHLKIPIFNNEV